MAYTLNNEFLDKLKHSSGSDYLKSLREFGTGLSRDELAKLTGLSIHSIRRYESDWINSKSPPWYELFLRLISGDLSYFGHYWNESRIIPQTQKLKIPYDQHRDYLPMDMYAQTNLLYRTVKNENNKYLAEIEALKKRISALELDNELQSVWIERLESENNRLKQIDKGIQSGKVINLFAERR